MYFNGSINNVGLHHRSCKRECILVSHATKESFWKKYFASLKAAGKFAANRSDTAGIMKDLL